MDKKVFYNFINIATPKRIFVHLPFQKIATKDIYKSNLTTNDHNSFHMANLSRDWVCVEFVARRHVLR